MKINLGKLSVLLLLLLSSTSIAFARNTPANLKNHMQIYTEENGIRIILEDIELYFNASNGGEITQYFDLTVDPSRSRNLVNLRWKPYLHLLPLFTSLFYKPPYPNLVYSTGGDTNAKLWLITNTSQYTIIQSSSRIMSITGETFKDSQGNSIYVNSTWIIRSTGFISVERTFIVSNYATISSGWRWYPFYLTRTAGFGYNGTFHMFNTTYAYSSTINEATYKNVFSWFSPLPNDTKQVFGIALPFTNVSLGGDGTHNILIAYKYNELVNADEWRSDNYYSKKNNITESGAVYEYNTTTKVYAHTYHALINFTRQPLNPVTLQEFAEYYAEKPSIALPIECTLTTNKNQYNLGDYYAFTVSGRSNYDFSNLKAEFTITNSLNQVIHKKNYGPGNTKAGQTFSLTLLTGTVRQSSVPGNYTLSFQIRSSFGIILTSSSKMITVKIS